MEHKTETVRRVRAFNRFYLSALSLLDNHYLGSQYAPTEARILFELRAHDGCNASFLAALLPIDKSYLSRVLKKFETGGLLSRTPDPRDARAQILRLTPKGRETTEALIRDSDRQIGELLAPLNRQERNRLVRSMDEITELLAQCRTEQEADP